MSTPDSEGLYCTVVYLEYQSVCPIVGIGYPTPSLASEYVSPLRPKGGGNTLLGGGGGEGKAYSDDWIESLALCILCETSQLGQYLLFSVVFTLPPLRHHRSVWLLPVISLLLTNTVFPVRAFNVFSSILQQCFHKTK